MSSVSSGTLRKPDLKRRVHNDHKEDTKNTRDINTTTPKTYFLYQLKFNSELAEQFPFYFLGMISLGVHAQ